jgi:hypothetical protein
MQAIGSLSKAKKRSEAIEENVKKKKQEKN